jgi:thioredoxin reductase
VIETTGEVGGIQRGNFHPNLWLLGAPGESGSEMSQRMADHFAALPLTCLLHTRVTAVSGAAGRFSLQLASPEGTQPLQAGAIILATGTYPRATPPLQALAARSPRIIVGPLSASIRDDIHGKDVLILGGGDNAFDHALFLAERGNRVKICTRRRFSARQPFQESCRQNPNITLAENCAPDAIDLAGESIAARWGESAARFDWLLVMYGYLPNTAVLDAFAPELRPARNAGGHILVDVTQRTSVPGIYAAGDVTETPQPSVPTALAQGLVAARTAERDMETWRD